MKSSSYGNNRIFLPFVVVLLVSYRHMDMSMGFLLPHQRQFKFFFPSSKQQQQQQRRLFGISEWRSASNSDDDSNRRRNSSSSSNNNNNNQKNHTLLLLPLSKDEALLPGETTSITLREGRYFDLLDEATTKYHSMIGTILLGDDDYLPVMPLCEIISYDLDAWPRGGITATIALKCVGRAKLTGICPPAASSILQFKPYLKGLVNELIDDHYYEEYDNDYNTNNHGNLMLLEDNIQTANQLIDDIEQLLERKGGGLSSSSSKTTKNEQQQQQQQQRNTPPPFLLYQQHYWLALTTLGYSPTSLLWTTRDPISSNRQKEIEAASWSAFVALKATKEERSNSKSSNSNRGSSASTTTSSNYVYEAIRTTNVLDRLRLALRASVEGNILLTTTTTTTTSDDDDKNLLLGGNYTTTSFPTSGTSSSSSSSNSFFDSSGFE